MPYLWKDIDLLAVESEKNHECSAGENQAFAALVDLLDHEDRDIRAGATYHVGKIGLPGTVGHLIKRMRDGDAVVRTCAAIGLGKKDIFRTDEDILDGIDALIPARLNDSDDGVQDYALAALNMLGFHFNKAKLINQQTRIEKEKHR